MATAIDVEKQIDELDRTLCQLANEHAESEICQRILNMPMTLARARVSIIQRNYFMLNRRDCWGFVQAKAPLDVKKLIWAHEHEELMGAAGKADHIAMNIEEGKALGLTPEDFVKTPPTPGTYAAMLAWRQIAQESPWLEGLAASCSLELSNSDEIVKKGSMSGRTATQFERQLGIAREKLVSSVEHETADIEHGYMLIKIARVHARTPEARAQVLSGARKSWMIGTVYKNELADDLERITS